MYFNITVTYPFSLFCMDINGSPQANSMHHGFYTLAIPDLNLVYPIFFWSKASIHPSILVHSWWKKLFNYVHLLPELPPLLRCYLTCFFCIFCYVMKGLAHVADLCLSWSLSYLLLSFPAFHVFIPLGGDGFDQRGLYLQRHTSKLDV
jgi:hypothetical protein